MTEEASGVGSRRRFLDGAIAEGGIADPGRLGSSPWPAPRARSRAAAPLPPESAASSLGSASVPESEASADEFLPADRALLRQWSQGQAWLEQGRYSDAIRCLQSILEAPDDYFFQPDSQTPTHSQPEGRGAAVDWPVAAGRTTAV